MEEGERITMSTKELERSEIIRQVVDDKILQIEAAIRLNLSGRQIIRIVKKYRKNGPKGLIHGLRGKSSHKAKKPQDKHAIMALWETKYRDFGPTFFAEKLLENEVIHISDETLRKWYPVDVPRPCWRRKKRPHRSWRPRKDHFGELVQSDGSFHDWFEGRGPKCNVQAMIDDATSTPLFRFYEYEGTLPAMDLTQIYIKTFGAPHRMYYDMHTTYKSPKKLTKEERIQGKEALSQYARALKDLSIKITYARSPEAKGRVERLFGTLQDRLVKELRLRNISTIDEANAFLEEYMPLFTARFSQKPKEQSDWHTRYLTPQHISRALCIKHTRVVQKDSTISYFNKRFLITDPICRTKITVETHLDGSLILRAPTDKELRYKRIPLELYEQRKQHINTTKTKKSKAQSRAHTPKPNHPWRKQFSRSRDLQLAKQR